MANPVFSNSKAFTSAPAQPMGTEVHMPTPFGGEENNGAMSYEGVVAKSAALFAVALASAFAAGLLVPQLGPLFGVVAFILSLVVIFAARREPKPGLYLATVAFYGAAAGSLSRYFEAAYNGIILQALLGTGVVFAVSLALYKSGRIRNVPKIRRFLMIAVPSYVIFSLVNVGMVWAGGPNIRDAVIPGTSVPLGVILSLFAITVGAFMFIADFDMIDNGVRNQLSPKWEWTAAYGLVFTIIWIYIEMLRLLSYLRGR